MARKKRKLALFKGDRSLWIIIAVLCVISILVVYSATVSMAYRQAGGDTTYYVLRQARFILGGFFTIIVVHWIDYRFYARYARTLFNISVILVLLAYFVGVSLNDAARWIRIPIIGLTFQPSDVLKISLIMVLASQLGARQGVIDRIPMMPALSSSAWRRNPQKNMDIFYKTTRPLIMPIVIAALVVMPSNLSTAIIIVVVAGVMLIVGRVRRGEIIRLMWVALLSLVVIVGGMKLLGVGRADTWINRVESFISPVIDSNHEQKSAEDEFQKQQARIAIASGGVIGKGPGNSTQRSQLPHPYSDFAYAFIVEEYGIVGGVVVMILYLWIFYRAGVIMRRSKRPSPSLLVLGLSLMITMQAFVNIAVSVGLIPVTGQSLPIISLGGSSVFFTCIAFGMILGVSRESDEAFASELALATSTAVSPPAFTTQAPRALIDRETPSDEQEESPFIVSESPYEKQENKPNKIDLYDESNS